MSVRNIERAFNALHSQHNEEAALADPAQARVQQAQTEADRLRSLSTSMTTADVIERILLHYAERDYFRLLELPAPEADVLGNVTWQGTALEVSKAYRRLSVLVHPDKNPGEDARKAFEALNEAHRVLKDADTRDTLLKEHLDAALGRRWGREARATLEERVALNAAQAQEAAALRKQETLQYEAQYLASLPLASTYERSYMHRDTVTAVAVARGTDFFLTASADGVLKFWKKLARGVEFAKQYRAHVGPITALAVSADGSLAATASTDASVKVFDIGSFDMIAMLRLPFVPGAIEWAFQRGIPVARLAVSDLATPAIAVFDARSGGDEELGRVTLHSSPVTAMKFSPEQGAVISVDAAGMVEYWDPGTLASPATGLRFDFKLDTDLYALARAGTTALSLAVARDGARWAALCADGRVRLFRYATGRLLKVLDESLAAAAELQRSGPEAFRLEPIDFGRRAAAEKELAAALGVVSADAGAGLGTRDAAPPRPATPNVVFDESGNFLLVPSLLGVKVVNLATNACAGVIGGGEGGERFLGLALFQGGGARGRRLLAAGAESAAAVDVAADPTLLACAAGRQRLYLFTRREPAEEASGAGGGRDVYNERPLGGEGEAGEAGGGGGGASGSAAAAPDLPRGAVVHTTRGDIALKLFPDECPRTVENFTTHARNGYYDGVLFHRVIKGFMLQTGDPLGDGTGGESIWGGEFEDEISRNLRHDRPFTLSMANAGPNTNGSQFFITTAATPWLDGKHTVFGRVVKGMDVVVSIEKCKTHPKTDKPFDDIRIINVEPRASVE